MSRAPAVEYFGTRSPAGCTVNVLRADGSVTPLLHVMLHSPTGFEWGYGGSGPADLALSILCDVLEERPTHEELYVGRFACETCRGSGAGSLGEESVCPTCEGMGDRGPIIAQRLYQRFKSSVIALLSRDDVDDVEPAWQIKADTVRTWIAAELGGDRETARAS